MALGDEQSQQESGMTRFVCLTDKLIQELRVLRQPPCALVIEDDRHDAELMTHTLRGMGVKTSVVSNGRDAISLIKESLTPTTPDLNIIFLDLKLPGGPDGPSILKEIRGLAPNLPVIVVTGTVDSPMVTEAAKLGYVGLVEKPLQPVDIQEILNKHRIRTQKPQLSS